MNISVQVGRGMVLQTRVSKYAVIVAARHAGDSSLTLSVHVLNQSHRSHTHTHTLQEYNRQIFWFTDIEYQVPF